jgi:hypothetical protein
MNQTFIFLWVCTEYYVRYGSSTNAMSVRLGQRGRSESPLNYENVQLGSQPDDRHYAAC